MKEKKSLFSGKKKERAPSRLMLPDSRYRPAGTHAPGRNAGGRAADEERDFRFRRGSGGSPCASGRRLAAPGRMRTSVRTRAAGEDGSEGTSDPP